MAALSCCVVWVSGAVTESAEQATECNLLDEADKRGAASCASAIEDYSTTKKLTSSECMW